MGHGIAQVSAMAGHEVVMRDIEAEFVESGLSSIETNLEQGVDLGKVSEDERDRTLEALSTTTDLNTAVDGADLVIEAIPEDLELKRETFAEVEPQVSDSCVLATNTSSLSVTAIFRELERPGRAIGLHFFNPVHIMELVELIVAEETTDQTQAFAASFVDSIDRTGAVVQDYPGFSSSRLAVAIGIEAIRMVQEGVASPEDIDTTMKLGFNHPMGPLELGDYVGLDTRLSACEYLHEELGARFHPPQLLKRKVRAGKYGRKSGEGFYIWEGDEVVGMSGEWGDR